jgi:hypothetical protein
MYSSSVQQFFTVFEMLAKAEIHSTSKTCVQTESGAHPASCTMGTGGPFPGVKRGRGVTLTIQPHLVPRLRMSRTYTSLPPNALVASSGIALDLVKYEEN